MSNYNATVVRIDNIRKHENADRLQCTNIFGNNVIIGLDTKVDDVGLFFPLESQIGFEFAQANDLIRRKDENGKPAGGMFDTNRRVRAQTFRGEKSMGFFIPLNALYQTFQIIGIECPHVKEGDDIGELGGIVISQKFELPKKYESTSKKHGRTKRSSRLIPGQFHFHFNTAQLGRNIDKINPDDLIAITWKMHGTSAIASYVKCVKKLSFIDKLAKKLGINVVDDEYDHLFASRHVVKNDDGKKCNHFYKEDLWTSVGQRFMGHLHKGESVYYEIVGFTSNGEAIQKDYDYGCAAYEHDVYVYRITQTNEDGVVTELPWNQVKHRAQEIGVKTVPEIYYGYACDFEDYVGDIEFNVDEWRLKFFNVLQKEYVYDQNSQFCKNKVPEEGVVVRVEKGDGIECFKLKSFKFLKKESDQLDSGEIDMESQES